MPMGRWSKVMEGNVLPMLTHKRHCRQYAYVYGRINADRLAGMENLDVVMVNEMPYPDGKVDVKRNRQMRRPWHYKFELIKRAIEDHGEVIYCDWDVACLAKDIPSAFELLGDKDVHLSAYMYKKVRHQFRAAGVAQHLACTGNWLHFRGTEFVDRVLDCMRSERFPWFWHDEMTMGYMIDEDHGGWPGEDVWLQKYESPIMVQRHRRSPWPLVSDDGTTVIRKTPVPFVWTRLFCQWGRFR